MSTNDPDELERPPAPSALDVARRALILCGVVCRGNLEHYKDNNYRRSTVETIHEWFDELQLWPYLDPEEEELIRAPFGKQSHLSMLATWYVEGLAILTWALRRGDFPPHSEKVDPIAVTDALDFLSPDSAKFLASAKLQPAKRIEAAREWFYDVHCALRGFLNHGGDGRLAPWIGDYVDALGLDRAEVMVEKGLAFERAPLADADRKRLEDWESVICERHRAAMWLVGDEDRYTEISVDT
jgi:hypothetical protein